MTGGLEIKKGSPDDEELAAVVVALEVVAAREVTSAAEPVSKWRTSLGSPTPRTEWRSRS